MKHIGKGRVVGYLRHVQQLGDAVFKGGYDFLIHRLEMSD